jgi:hypothetical protein
MLLSIAASEKETRSRATQSAVIVRARRNTLKASKEEILTYLKELLPEALLRKIANIKDQGILERWMKGNSQPDLDAGTGQRLRAAYEIAQMLSDSNSPELIRAWFAGPDPQLSEMSPAQAIHDGRLKEAIAAARVFVISG